MNVFDQLAEVIGNTQAPIGKIAAAERVLEAFVVIPKAGLPTVQRQAHDNNSYRTDGESVIFMNAANAKMWVMRDVAVWQYLEAESAEAVKRDRRRDELAAEFTAVNSYNGQLPYTQKLIDRIISLEGAAK